MSLSSVTRRCVLEDRRANDEVGVGVGVETKALSNRQTAAYRVVVRLQQIDEGVHVGRIRLEIERERKKALLVS